MAQLTGSTSTIPLGEPGYGIRAPGVTGVAQLQRARPADVRSRSRSDADGTTDLDRALAATGVEEIRQVDLSVRVAAATGTPLRSASGEDTIELEVPDFGADYGQLVLACDEAGGLSWHLPLSDTGAVQPPTTRGSGGVKRFRIPAQPRPQSADTQARSRSILGVVGRKLLKVLIYPVTDPVIGFIADKIASRWESANRPYGVRTFEPHDFRAPARAGLTAEDWTRLSSGRSLLFIHGTFSTAHGAFAQLDDSSFGALHQRYGGRVFAFNHFTLSEDPTQNVAWLLKHTPPGVSIDCDVICHSRGGLVTRVLIEQPGASSPYSVKRAVFVGVPNQGTLLAEPDHMVKMIDRMTTALNVLPTGVVAEVLEALITAVKTIGHGGLKGLDGLRSMQPGGTFLKAMNVATQRQADYFGISSNYEPADEGLKAIIGHSVINKVVDTVFQNTGNDLVVPEAGVHTANGGSLFPIAATRSLQIAPEAGVSHVTFFSHAPARQKLLDWLQ